MEIGIPGEHQKQNASLACEALHHLPLAVDESSIRAGLKTVVWYGRFQMIRQAPLIIFDVGHNSSGIATFISTWKSIAVTGRKNLIISLQEKKEIRDVADDLQRQFHDVICTEAPGGKPMDALQLMSYFRPSDHLKVMKDPNEAIQTVLEQMTVNDSLVILGSHYLGPAVNKNFELSFQSLENSIKFS